MYNSQNLTFLSNKHLNGNNSNNNNNNNNNND